MFSVHQRTFTFKNINTEVVVRFTHLHRFYIHTDTQNMSLNTAHASGGVLIFSGERILIFYDGVEMAFDMENNLPHFKGKKKGRVYLTTHRVIFNSKDQKDTLQSFSMPFHCMREVELEQPVFGANYIKGKIVSEPNGNWEGTGKWKMWFNNGGAIDFGRAMLQAGRLASKNRPAQPPAYSPPAGPYYQAPPTAYAPPQDPMYGFVPYQTFPTPPPYESVYTTQAPPPYPGINPNAPPYPPQAPQPSQVNGYPPAPPASAADAKAAEAGMSNGGQAYYAPSNPHNVYMPQQASAPPPAYGEAPPAYNDLNKKSQ